MSEVPEDYAEKLRKQYVFDYMGRPKQTTLVTTTNPAFVLNGHIQVKTLIKLLYHLQHHCWFDVTYDHPSQAVIIKNHKGQVWFHVARVLNQYLPSDVTHLIMTFLPTVEVITTREPLPPHVDGLQLGQSLDELKRMRVIRLSETDRDQAWTFWQEVTRPLIGQVKLMGHHCLAICPRIE